MTMVERARRAMIESLLKQPQEGGRHGCLFDGLPERDAKDIVVRGHIDMHELARVVIKALRKPTDEMWAAFGADIDRGVFDAFWGSAIDAALTETQDRAALAAGEER